MYGADEIAGGSRISDAPDAGRPGGRRMNRKDDRCEQSAAREDPRGGTLSSHQVDVVVKSPGRVKKFVANYRVNRRSAPADLLPSSLEEVRGIYAELATRR